MTVAMIKLFLIVFALVKVNASLFTWPNDTAVCNVSTNSSDLLPFF